MPIQRERERRIRDEGKMGRDLQKAILIAVVWREQRRVNTRELEFFRYKICDVIDCLRIHFAVYVNILILKYPII